MTLGPSHTIVYEVRGQIKQWTVKHKQDIKNPSYLHVVQDTIVPMLQRLDTANTDGSSFKLHANLYKITHGAFNTLFHQFKAGTYRAMSLKGSTRFQLGPDDVLPDYTLVVFRPPDFPQVDEQAEPFFLREPSLKAYTPSLNPSSSDLQPSFIKVQLRGEFQYDDLQCNNIEHVLNHAISAVTVPLHVQGVWNSLARSRNMTDLNIKTLERKLIKYEESPKALEKLFNVVASKEERLAAAGKNGDHTEENRNEEMMIAERKHYAHIIRSSTDYAPIKTFSPKIGVERASELFFFTPLASFFMRFLSDFDVLDTYQKMPIAKLVIEKLDEQLDVYKYAPYYPRSDLGIWYHGSIWPGALVELQSGTQSTTTIEHSPDHIRMFLQGASLLRMMNIAKRSTDNRNNGTNEPSDEDALLPLIYITKDWSRASLYLLFELGPKVCYLHRVYNFQHNISQRFRFTRDLYNLAEYIGKHAPSNELKDSLKLIDNQLLSIKTVANRVDKEDDKKRKRGGDEEQGGDKDLKQKRTQESDEDGEHRECIYEALRLGYKLSVSVISPILLIGESPNGNRIVAKKVHPDSKELKIHSVLQELRGSINFVLLSVRTFNVPLEGPTTASYLVFPYWVPLSELSSHAVQSSQLVAICSDIASGVIFLHENLIAHLDLKPDNLVMERDLAGGVQIRIIDFSVSVMLSSKDQQQSTYQGTEGYMAPEVAECKGNTKLYSPFKADLFSCGQVFLFLAWWITERTPFKKVFDWGNKLIARDPCLRPDLVHLPGLMDTVDLIPFYRESSSAASSSEDL
ncbi:hypothetical protein D9757_004101 [Collybiopsis confluens]|uniref:non-specific serine/threonine protein kinase n=1 Tax=Collybiopsis confluens TaxID=2823264 RepID=A0A8H5HU64_9AGAR|nr:hypothetical protein D9757_004101 [Collybiopsis confluens]